MTRKILKIVFFLLLFSFACGHEKPKDDNKSSPDSSALNSDHHLVKDTIVILKNIKSSKYKGPNLTYNLAREVLYEHFKANGFWTPDDVSKYSPSNLPEKDYYRLCVNIRNVYYVNFNNNKYSDAIILYWLTPPFACGHCYQPHKAIIVDTDNGYSITNEEFIHDNFVIDSLASIDNSTILYCYDYNCSDNIELRKLRILLITK